MTVLADKLKENYLKVTPQRLEIYKMLVNSTEHPCVETIYKSILERFPSISLATVYKTLNSLCNAKLLQELSVGEGRFRYDACTEPHQHIVCTLCQRVDDLFINDTLQNNKICEMRQSVENSTDYRVTSEQIYYYGICKKCQ